VLYSADVAPFAMLLESQSSPVDTEVDTGAVIALANAVMVDANARTDNHFEATSENNINSDIFSADGIREVVLVVGGDIAIDSLVSKLQTDVDSSTKIELVEADSNNNILVLFADILSRYENLDAIHIVSHASDGELRFGSQSVDTQNLNSNKESLTRIGDALKADGDILLYGCNLSASDAGQVFAETLSSLTNADVASSNDLTGHSAIAGDWDLEVVEGIVETKSVVSPQIQSDWSATLNLSLGLLHLWQLDGDGIDSVG